MIFANVASFQAVEFAIHGPACSENDGHLLRGPIMNCVFCL